MNDGFGTKVTVWPTGGGSSTSFISPTLPTFEEPVKSFTLMEAGELERVIEQNKVYHKRPISDVEYSRLLKLLKEQKDETGRLLYKHDLAAIARVVKENFEKFFPDISLDYHVTNSLEFHYEVDHILKSMYDHSLEKYRQPFVVATAEEVKDQYSPDEIVRLRNLGVAFNSDKYKVYDTVETLLVESGDTKRKGFIKRSYQHPMLKYNLLKGSE